MTHKSKNVTHRVGTQRTPIRRRCRLLVALAIACGGPALASAQAYPNGASTTGRVTQVATYQGVSSGVILYFVVTGTLDNGSTGSQPFFIQDPYTTEGGVRIANVLAAAAQGLTISIWNYGVTYSYGGQTGYMSDGEYVSFP